MQFFFLKNPFLTVVTALAGDVMFVICPSICRLSFSRLLSSMNWFEILVVRPKKSLRSGLLYCAECDVGGLRWEPEARSRLSRGWDDPPDGWAANLASDRMMEELQKSVAHNERWLPSGGTFCSVSSWRGCHCCENAPDCICDLDESQINCVIQSEPLYLSLDDHKDRRPPLLQSSTLSFFLWRHFISLTLQCSTIVEILRLKCHSSTLKSSNLKLFQPVFYWGTT